MALLGINVTSLKMSYLCRVCMCTDFKHGSVLDDYLDGIMVSQLIMTICNVSISKEDGLPELICPDCFHELKNALTFKLKCEKTDTILRASYSDDTSNTKSKTDLLADVKMEFKTDVEDSSVHYDNEIPDIGLDLDNKPETYLTIPSEKKYNIKKLKHRCEECGNMFRTKQERNAHLKQHGFICDICKKKFKTKYAIENHFRLNNRDCLLLSDGKSVIVEGIGKNRLFCCMQCNYKTSRLVHMRPHLITHTGLKPYACELCPRAYTQLGPLQYHKQLVHEKRNLSIPCDVCGKILPSKRHFYKHIRVHSEAKYTCDICNARLKRKSTLADHMTRHIGIKNLTCEICAAAFFTQPELYNHLRIHKVPANRRPYQCPQCEYRATKKYCLKKHLARHSDDKPFSCQHCGQLYETALLLDKHIRIHDKLYKCPICESMHSKIVYLKQHLSKYHKVNYAVKELNIKVQQLKDIQGKTQI